jgi:predicted metal-binding membrane protein
MSETSALNWTLRRDRVVVAGTLAVAVTAAWAYILLGAGMDVTSDESMGGMMMPMAWTPGLFVLMLVMWSAMMMGMMLPSAAPMILLFATIQRRRGTAKDRHHSVAAFVAGYVAVWIGFSVLASCVQWILDDALLLSSTMASRSTVLASALLFAAGIYQLTPLKLRCLRQCRSPLEFLSERWRNGANGAFIMGLQHGLYCLGCCWVLMCLLFVGGLMNLAWVAGLAIYVALEKIGPAGPLLSRLAGAGLIAWSAVLLLRSTA